MKAGISTGKTNGLAAHDNPSMSKTAGVLWSWHDLLTCALLFGVAVFLYNCWIGFWALSPSHVDWLYWGDHRQSFAAQNLYKNSPWQFPLGRITNADFPVGTNIVFMDGNLLLAIAAKLLAPITGAHAQLYGIWIFICLLLQLYSIYWALRQLDVPPAFACLGCLPLALLPTFYFRLPHLNLLAHFLVIFGWGTLLSRHLSGTRKFNIFLILICASILIHAYFTPPLIMMAILAQWRVHAFRLDRNAALFVCRKTFWIAATAFVVMFCTGYFEKFRSDAGGFGYFSMNLNALINPIWNTSTFVKTLPMGTAGQYEGYQYLGLGLILLLVVCAWTCRRRMLSGIDRPVWIFWVLLILLSLSNRIFLGSVLLFALKIPHALEGPLQSFRASGRYAWFVVYPLLLIILANAWHSVRRDAAARGKSPNVTIVSVVVVLTLLQFKDITPLMITRHYAHSQAKVTGQLNAANSIAQYLSDTGFAGPIYIDTPNEELRVQLYTPLSTLVNTRDSSLSPAPDVRENMKYTGRDHIHETLDARGIVITHACGSALAARKVDFAEGWCGFIR